MTANTDIQAAWDYHNATKHSWESLRSNRHHLDFENQPLPFKIFKGLEPIPLPRDPRAGATSAMEAIGGVAAATASRDLTVHDIAKLSYLAAGVTRRRRIPGGEIAFRAAPCTGALYHIELYLACGTLDGIEPGLYHVSMHDFALRRLRNGDYRGVLIQASGYEPAMRDAPAIFAFTSTFWRNAWKYQSRAYRHAFWDSGTILANFLSVARADGTPARLILGFEDAAVNNLLGVEPRQEATVALAAVGSHATPASDSPPVPPVNLATEPLSRTQVEYPGIRKMHAASSLTTPDEAVAWRGSTPKAVAPVAQGRVTPLEGPFPAADTIEEVILKRGSSRRFAHQPISFTQLSNALDVATRGIEADFLDRPGDTLLHLYLTVHAVDGLTPGAYYFRQDERVLELLHGGDLRDVSGRLGLEQELPADAAVNVFFLTDLDAALKRFGNRGYRAAQIEAGIAGGKLYLAAYAQGFGATGLTFYDDDVTDFFAPHAASKSAMFLVAMGVPEQRHVPTRGH